MKLPTRQPSLHGMPGLIGTVRMDRRVGTVLGKAQPGDVAVIDHLDLDRATAEALLERGVAAVVNASPFISGRYPNLGPELLVKAGVTLVEAVDADVFSRLRDGGRIRVLDGTVYAGDEVLLVGRVLSLEDVQQRMDEAREGLTSQLQTLTHNTTEFLRREPDLLLHGQGIPELRTEMRGRPVVVVVRDFDHETDLRRLRHFIHEQRPVLVGVDAGADALLGARLTPDVVIVGDDGFPRPGAVQARAISDTALTSAREVVLHSEVEDRAVGSERLDRLGVRFHRFAAGGSTEDVALLIADARDASLIVTVGTHATLDEFLDRQRGGLASTFLTRLRVGPRLVDAKSVPVLYSGRVRLWQLLAVLLAGLLAVAVAVAVTPRGEVWAEDLRAAVDPLFDWIRGLLT